MPIDWLIERNSTTTMKRNFPAMMNPYRSLLAALALTVGSTNADVIEGWTWVDTVDYDRVIGAWNFTREIDDPVSSTHLRAHET